MDTNGTTIHQTEDEAQLALLRDKRAALAEAREARQIPSVKEKLAIAQRALAVDEAIDRLEQEHGKLGKGIQVVRVDDETDGRAVILKRPIMTVYRRYQDSAGNETKDVEKLVRPCVVFPSIAEFDARTSASKRRMPCSRAASVSIVISPVARPWP